VLEDECDCLTSRTSGFSFSFCSVCRVDLSHSMPNRCVAFGCKSGYYKKQADNDGPKIAFHSFPTDKELITKWNKANPRKDKASQLTLLTSATTIAQKEHGKTAS